MPPGSLENLGTQILERLNAIEKEVTQVKTHESQNGGWVKVNESLKALTEKVESIDQKISDPEEGVIARLRDVEQWQRDTDIKLSAEDQNNRMMRMETSFQLQEQKIAIMSKLGWIATSTVVGLVIKTFYDLLHAAG